MKYVADTNVISELMKPKPAEAVIDWFCDHEGAIYLTSISVTELYSGVLHLPEGARRSRLVDAISAIVMDCSGKTLGFDGFSAFLCAQFESASLRQGKTMMREDAMVAALCQRNDCVLATRNTEDFDHPGIDVVNPFEYRVLA